LRLHSIRSEKYIFHRIPDSIQNRISAALFDFKKS
jgi:hypothetical protein